MWIVGLNVKLVLSSPEIYLEAVIGSVINFDNLEVSWAPRQVEQRELNLSVPVGVNVEASEHTLMGSIPDGLRDHRACDVTSVLMLQQLSQRWAEMIDNSIKIIDNILSRNVVVEQTHF